MIWITIKIAMKALLRNKMRTALTMLGIIIGVAAVIAMISIGQGAQKSVLESIESNGTNTITIFSQTASRGGIMGSGQTITLSVEDGEAIEQQAKHINGASPVIRSVARVIYRGKNWSTGLNAGNTRYLKIRNWEIESGRSFSESEDQSAAKVAVLGQVVKDELFGDVDPIGRVIRINKLPFTVIGVLQPKGQSGWGGNMDDQIIIPEKTAMRHFYKKTYVPMLIASANTREESEAARDEIISILRQRHHLRHGEDDDFDIRTQEDIIKSANESTQVFTILLAAIASVSLLVGGIGIMNIMLVSVTERIREIGIRIAIGARQKDILRQFLIEAAVLSVIGGIVGVGVGAGTAMLIAKIAKWQMLVSPQSIIIALVFSGAIGIFFGFYPAYKASKLNPIDALRQE